MTMSHNASVKAHFKEGMKTFLEAVNIFLEINFPLLLQAEATICFEHPKVFSGYFTDTEQLRTVIQVV